MPAISTLSQDPVSSKNTQNIPSPPIPAPQPPHQSEHVTWPLWIKQAANIQKEHDLEAKALNKSRWDAQDAKWKANILKTVNLILEDEMIYSTQEFVDIAEQAYWAAVGNTVSDNYQAAMALLEAQFWQKAMESEIEMLEQRKTFA